MLLVICQLSRDVIGVFWSIYCHQGIWYYAIVRFRTIDLKSHPIAQFEENQKKKKKMLNSSKLSNEF